MRLNIYLAIAFLTGVSAKSFSQSKGDSIKIAIEPVYNTVSKTHQFLLGDNYRKLWATPVTLRIFHLTKEKGGLTILQPGGGMQTKSLRLQDPTGQEWVLRTIQKYPERVLPPNLRETIAKDIVQDQISDEHPFASLTVPIMAAALGVPHANPEIVYVPDDPTLGKYRKDYANQVFLFEEREPLDASKTDNTGKAQDKLQDDNDNRVDQKLVLRARLLDMLLGDWDRHEDQWRWERVKNDTGIVYKPVPRDRDQVYYYSTGVLPWLVSRYLLMAKFQDFHERIRSISRWNLNARNFDRYFLNGLSQQDWEEQIAYVQSKLTDQLINQALMKMPADIYQLSGKTIQQKLIARRNILKEQGLKYYRSLAQTVTVSASEKHERFDITNLPGGKVSLKINKIKKDGTPDQIIYQRVFDPKVTNEIRLYGMGGPDVYTVHGDVHTPINIRMIGNDKKDQFLVDSNIIGKGNRYIYDIPGHKNTLPKGQANLNITADTSLTNFHRLGFVYDFLEVLPLASYSKDYGFQLIGNFVYQKQGFGKEPYAFRQNFMASYGFGINSLLLHYTGEFKKVVANNDLIVNVINKGPNYSNNFFGVGNNTTFINEGTKKIHYYRNVYNYIATDVRLKHIYDNWTVSAGVAGQYYNGDPDDNKDRFLKDYNTQHPEENVYAGQGVAGLVAGFSVDTRDKGIISHKGIYWSTELTAMKSLNSNSHTYGQVLTDLRFLIPINKDSTVMIANRTGGGTTLGNPAFYQQLKLGGSENLRGFYDWRFTGKSMVYNNLELRVKLMDFASYLLPGTLGFVAFDDIGRVWTPNETSNTWHNGFGGGFYFLPAQLILVQTVVGFSKEGAYPYISAGFRF
jgi:type VI protein secretion system component Hcp